MRSRASAAPSSSTCSPTTTRPRPHPRTPRSPGPTTRLGARVCRSAVAALLAAGDAARERLALEQAERFADRALALAGSDGERLAALELRASALHAAVRSDEAFAAYREGLKLARGLGDAIALSRLRAHAALLCSRYSGAFTDTAWRAPAVELVERGLEEVGERTISFEVGALLIGRSAIGARWFDEPSGREATAERDARRAIEIAEALDSPFLLSHAVEALVEYASRGGFCDAGALGERLVEVCEKMPDRLEAHEGLVTAAISFARAGRYEQSRAVARQATLETVRLSAHHTTHAAAGETFALAHAGRFAELLDVTDRVVDVVRDEGGRLCQMGGVGLAGHALALHERGEPEAAREAMELLWAAPPPRGLVPFRCFTIELLRPLAGLETARDAVASCVMAHTTGSGRLHGSRLELQLMALGSDLSGLEPLIARSRELASRACAPAVAWIADWAEAVSRARAGDGEAAVVQAESATAALAEHGEPYTAARLLVDLLPFLDGELRAPLADRTSERLEAMGALASAAEAAALATALPGVP